MNFLIAIVDDDESYRAATTDLVRSPRGATFQFTLPERPESLSQLGHAIPTLSFGCEWSRYA